VVATVMVHINVKAAILRENKQECFQQLGSIRAKKKWGKTSNRSGNAGNETAV